MRWANLARAVGVRMNGRAKALVAASYLLVPNLLCPFLDVRCLHIVLVSPTSVPLPGRPSAAGASTLLSPGVCLSCCTEMH